MAKVCPQCGTRYEEDQRFCSKDGATLVAEQQGETLTGIVLADRYLVRDKLGEGGMGEVYLAEHVRIKRKVAVKVMRNWLTTDTDAILRFHREAENASQITHPNVAAVYDFGETKLGNDKKLVYLAMEYVPGKPLTTILEQERTLNHIRTSDIVSQVADALSAAHSLGILHRDLKPDNVMIAETRVKTDLVKLLDFGIARVMDKKTQHFTSTGMIVGTPEWMSPEQISGDALKTGTDIYALGLMAFRMLTGEGAFGGGSPQDILLAKMSKPPARLSEARADIAWPAALQGVFDRVLSADPGSRYDDALAFAKDFYYAVTQLPMTPDAEAYLAALSQRAVTPTRGIGTVESTTPVVGVQGLTDSGQRPTFVSRRPTPASSTAAIPEGELPEGARAAGSDAERVSEEITAPIAVDKLIAASNAETAEIEPLATPASTAATAGAASGRGKALFYGGAAAAVVLVAAFAIWAASATGSGNGNGAPNATADSTAMVARGSSDSGGPDAATLAAMGPIISATAMKMPLDTVRARSERSVFRIVGSKGQGAGFLADSQGVVLTSSTFVGGDDTVSVFLDGSTRLLGRVLAVDSARGLAAVRIPMRRCRNCSALALATDPLTVQAGDSVLIVGAPSLVASRRPATRGSVAERDDARGRLTAALRSNVPGVGGPVLVENQVVIGVARPGTASATSSVTTLSSAKDFLDTAIAALARTPAIDSVPPTWPRRAVRAEAMAELQGRTREEILRRYGMVNGDFDILVMTPQVMGWRQSQARQARENSPSASDYCAPRDVCDILEEWRSGRDYVSERRAVVIVQVSPRTAQQPKFGAFAKVQEFRRGNVGAVALVRDGTSAQPIESARVHAVANPQAYAENQRYYSAIYVYSADVFAGAKRIDLTILPEGGRGAVTFQLRNEILQAVVADIGPYATR